jgi:hypothetical protein
MTAGLVADAPPSAICVAVGARERLRETDARRADPTIRPPSVASRTICADSSSKK